MEQQITIEIAYALPNKHYLKKFNLNKEATVQIAILQSGILEQYKEIDLR